LFYTTRPPPPPPPFIIDAELSKRINSLRFILIFFVVFIHNGAITKGVNFFDGNEIYNIPIYVEKIIELVSSFTCVAVPLFFIISSSLLYSKKDTFIGNIKKKMKTIILPYFLWIVLTIAFYYIAQSFLFTRKYFATLIIKNFTIIDWIQAFIGKINAAESPTLHLPIIGQFWFLRDLIILNIFCLPIKKVIDKFPVSTFVLLLVLCLANPQIYIINAGALFWFAVGYYVVKYNLSYKTIDKIKFFDLVLIYLIIIISRLFLYKYVPVIGFINVIVALIFFIKLSSWFIKNDVLYNIFNWLKEYAFWIYALHGLLEAVLIKLSVLIIPMRDGWLLLQYFGVVIVTTILLLIIGICIQIIMPKIYSLLTGGRIK
jgi:fucose 4-O-acetylase-like acetyltransferase